MSKIERRAGTLLSVGKLLGYTYLYVFDYQLSKGVYAAAVAATDECLIVYEVSVFVVYDVVCCI